MEGLMQESIPVLAEPRDTLRNGLGTLKDEASPAHPVQVIQEQYEIKQHQNKKFMLAKVYGTHMPEKMHIEETVLSRVQRYPGLKSSFIGLETLLGKDTTIEFSDYLSDPQYSTERLDVHAEMERRWGDKPLSRI